VRKNIQVLSPIGEKDCRDIKFLELFTEMKHCLVPESASGLKDSERGVRSSTMVEEVCESAA